MTELPELVGRNEIALICDVCGFSEAMCDAKLGPDIAFRISRDKGWRRTPEPTRVKNTCPTCANGVALSELRKAVVHAGFRVGPDLLGEPTLWCLTCSRDSGYHWDGCRRLTVFPDRGKEPAK